MTCGVANRQQSQQMLMNPSQSGYYVELISKDEVNLPFRAGDLKISKLHLGKAVMSKVAGTAGSIEEEQNVHFCLMTAPSGRSEYRDMNCSFSSYKRSTSLLLLQACVNSHLETPLAQRNCYRAEGKFLGLNLVRMRLDIQRDSTDTDECQLRAEGKGSDRARSDMEDPVTYESSLKSSIHTSVYMQPSRKESETLEKEATGCLVKAIPCIAGEIRTKETGHARRDALK